MTVEPAIANTFNCGTSQWIVYMGRGSEGALKNRLKRVSSRLHDGEEVEEHSRRCGTFVSIM